jgi:hypothetical protein
LDEWLWAVAAVESRAFGVAQVSSWLTMKPCLYAACWTGRASRSGDHHEQDSHCHSADTLLLSMCFLFACYGDTATIRVRQQ